MIPPDLHVWNRLTFSNIDIVIDADIDIAIHASTDMDIYASFHGKFQVAVLTSNSTLSTLHYNTTLWPTLIKKSSRSKWNSLKFFGNPVKKEIQEEKNTVYMSTPNTHKKALPLNR